MQIKIFTPARLHFGQLDLSGTLGRLYGGVGVAIEKPNVILEVSPASQLMVTGFATEKVADLARHFFGRYQIKGGARIHVTSVIPEHVGLGSGTQLSLAVATALARLYRLNQSPRQLAQAMNRGESRSGIGLGAFESGGFVVDGGLVLTTADRSKTLVAPPPILARYPFPSEWYFVVAIPEEKKGLSGTGEMNAFRKLPPMPDADSGSICRLVLMKMLPAILEEDIERFGQAVTEIQCLVGSYFAPVQGGRFSNQLCAELADYMQQHGAYGIGQSSWGPAVYGIVQGKKAAEHLTIQIGRYLSGKGRAVVFYTRASNTGALIAEDVSLPGHQATG